MADTAAHAPRRVGLFVTCLVDLFRPSVGLAAARLLEDAGCTVEVPPAQFCCGQPAWKAGEEADFSELAKSVIGTFEDFDHVVAPSGACASVLKTQYPAVFAGDPVWEPRARAFASRVHELMDFLVDVLGVTSVRGGSAGSVACHGCAGMRGGRRLLAGIDGLRLVDIPGEEVACSSTSTIRTEAIRAAGAGTFIAGELGCLMVVAGRLRREGSAIEVRHVAEVLAGMNDTPPIGSQTSRRAG